MSPAKKGGKVSTTLIRVETPAAKFERRWCRFVDRHEGMARRVLLHHELYWHDRVRAGLATLDQVDEAVEESVDEG